MPTQQHHNNCEFGQGASWGGWLRLVIKLLCAVFIVVVLSAMLFMLKEAAGSTISFQHMHPLTDCFAPAPAAAAAAAVCRMQSKASPSTHT
jgi:hypothetical protein